MFLIETAFPFTKIYFHFATAAQISHRRFIFPVF